MKKAAVVRFVAVVVLALFVFAGYGCAGTHPEYSGRTNFLGLIETVPGSYQPNDETSLTIRSRELLNGDEVTGTEIRLLWGLIRYTQY